MWGMGLDCEPSIGDVTKSRDSDKELKCSVIKRGVFFRNDRMYAPGGVCVVK